MYVYIYIYVCVYTYVYVCIYIYVCVYVYMYVCIRIMYMCMCVYVYVNEWFYNILGGIFYSRISRILCMSNITHGSIYDYNLSRHIVGCHSKGCAFSWRCFLIVHYLCSYVHSYAIKDAQFL